MADPKRPSPRERVDRAAAAVRPAVDKARAKAEPQVEKAAAKAGSLFGQLRERAKDTAKSFGEGYGKSSTESTGSTGSTERGATAQQADPPDEPHRRPRPGPR